MRNFNHAWVSHLSRIMKRGYASCPRNHFCQELLNAHITIPMTQPILTVKARKLGYRFLFAEAHWILTGDNRVESISPYSKSIAQFSDDGNTYFGAYGPKILDQLSYVVNSLKADNDTRQAVINIWREKPPASKDIPCTLSVQFLLRAKALHTIVTMRSSDAWLGIPYDVFNFTCLTWYVAMHLQDVTPGLLHYNLGSAHIYASEIPAVEEIIKQPQLDSHAVGSSMMFLRDSPPGDLIEWLRQMKDWTPDKRGPFCEVMRARYP